MYSLSLCPSVIFGFIFMFFVCQIYWSVILFLNTPWMELFAELWKSRVHLLSQTPQCQYRWSLCRKGHPFFISPFSGWLFSKQRVRGLSPTQLGLAILSSGVFDSCFWEYFFWVCRENSYCGVREWSGVGWRRGLHMPSSVYAGMSLCAGLQTQSSKSVRLYMSIHAGMLKIKHMWTCLCAGEVYFWYSSCFSCHIWYANLLGSNAWHA